MEKLLFKLPKYPFDYWLLSDILRDYSYPRNKINSLLRKKIIIRIKKGLYLLSPEYGGQIDRFLVANLIYGPSYVSLDSALSFWGVIPEKVETVSSITNKRNKSFETPVGRYIYKYRNDHVFYKGIMLINNGEKSYMIASREKAICDSISTVNEIRDIEDMDIYFRENMRIDVQDLHDLDFELINNISNAYNLVSVSVFGKWWSHLFKKR